MRIDCSLGHMPVHSLEAEQNVLGAILIDPRVIDDVSTVVSAEDFYATQHEIIFRTMLESSEIDAVIIAEKLCDHDEFGKGGIMSVLAEIMGTVHVTAHAVHYAKIVRGKSLFRKTEVVISHAFARCKNRDDRTEIITELENGLFQIGTEKTNEPVTMQTALTETLNDATASGKAWPTGYEGLDDLVTGFRDGQMVVIAARPSMGKTALSVNVALRMAAKGTEILFFSLEMSQSEITQRMIAVTGECDLKTEVMATNKPTWTQKKIGEAVNKIHDYPIYIDATPSRTMAEIESLSRSLVRKHGVNVIVIDHMGWIETGENRQSEYDKMTMISRRLKNLARKLNVPVVVLSQLSRNVENRKDFRPRMSDLRSSGAIEQDADVVIFIHREEYYLAKTEAEDKGLRGVAEIIVAKARNASTGSVKLRWEPSYTKFDDMPIAEEWDADGVSSF